MGKFEKIGSALSRYKASKGFGVHSPFAYSFITDVLDEKYGYYSYETLQQLRNEVVERTRNEQGYKPHVISLTESAVLFRVANRYNPSLFMSVGVSYGVAIASMLMVSHRSRVVVSGYEPGGNAAADEVIASYGERVVSSGSISEAYTSYIDMLADGENCFVVINHVSMAEMAEAAELVDKMVSKTGVLVLRNIDKLNTASMLWEQCRAAMHYGMTFTNGKMAVVVLNPKLPRQDFGIWLS